MPSERLSRFPKHPKTEQILSEICPGVAVRFRRLRYDWQRYQDLDLLISSGIRSFEEQQKLYNQGRVTPGKIVTNAKPGKSLHNYGLALDVFMGGKDPFLSLNRELWDLFGAFAESTGFTWGGRFKLQDKCHIECSFTMSADTLLKIYDFNGLTGVYYQVDKICGMT